MSARELGRRAALLHLKTAQTTTASSGTSSAGGTGATDNFGGKPAVSSVPRVAPAPHVPSPSVSRYPNSNQGIEAANAQPLPTYSAFRNPQTAGTPAAAPAPAPAPVAPPAPKYPNSNQGIEAQNAQPLPTYAGYRNPRPPAAPVAVAPRQASSVAGTARPAAAAGGGGSGGGGMLGGLAGMMKGLNPETLAAIMSSPMFKNLTQPLLGMGGFPMLSGLSDLALHGGENVKNIMEGPVGSGNVYT